MSKFKSCACWLIIMIGSAPESMTPDIFVDSSLDLIDVEEAVGVVEMVVVVVIG